MARKKTGRKKVSRRKTVARKTRSQSKWRNTWKNLKPWVLRGVVVLIVLAIVGVVYLDITIRTRFEGGAWAIPAHVYTRPMDLYIGQSIDMTDVIDELEELGYREQSAAPLPGTYERVGSSIVIHAREFRFWDQLREARKVRLGFNPARDRITTVTSDGQDLSLFQLEGRLFGSVSPVSHEDRELLTAEQVPQGLIDALIAIEDKNFYSHWGISPTGILRAAVANLMQGRVVQGGSTLTQQLVKNYFLTAEQTITRKALEAVMAVLLELHYSKDQVLLAYINEINLSQAGNRAIHGFGLGSQFLFGRPIQELNTAELATLAGLIKGPSYYNPVRHPERAIKRRNLVLSVMQEQGYLSGAQAGQLKQLPLGTGKAASGKQRNYPDFLDLVRQQLRKDYEDAALSDAGLRIYTTLDPRIQNVVENAISTRLKNLEQARGMEPGILQAAAIMVRIDNGEVVALAGGRKHEFAGYNRALDAIRPVGSLLKPVVYLAALEQPQNFGLGTLISDESITVSQRGSPDWTPQNHDGEQHGQIMLLDGLKYSYNLATVNLGMEVGLDAFQALLARLDYTPDGPVYPSALLGALPMSVSNVVDIYLTIANGGFKAPFKSVSSVLSSDGEPLNRYSLSIKQAVEPAHAALLVHAMQQVVMDGTARSIGRRLGGDKGFAGKTGTTDGYRDSWYAGFSGDYLMVVWLGRDDNESTGLSGAAGAAQIWADVFSNIKARPLLPPSLPEIEMIYVDSATGLKTDSRCATAVLLPYITGFAPEQARGCSAGVVRDAEPGEPRKKRRSIGEWFRDLFK